VPVGAQRRAPEALGSDRPDGNVFAPPVSFSVNSCMSLTRLAAARMVLGLQLRSFATSVTGRCRVAS
jgi:hypothetical protein